MRGSDVQVRPGARGKGSLGLVLIAADVVSPQAIGPAARVIPQLSATMHDTGTQDLGGWHRSRTLHRWLSDSNRRFVKLACRTTREVDLMDKFV